MKTKQIMKRKRRERKRIVSFFLCFFLSFFVFTLIGKGKPVRLTGPEWPAANVPFSGNNSECNQKILNNNGS